MTFAGVSREVAGFTIWATKPIPPANLGARKKPRTLALEALGVGECIIFGNMEIQALKNLTTTVAGIRKKTGSKLSVRRSADGFGVWRIT